MALFSGSAGMFSAWQIDQLEHELSHEVKQYITQLKYSSDINFLLQRNKSNIREALASGAANEDQDLEYGLEQAKLALNGILRNLVLWEAQLKKTEHAADDPYHTKYFNGKNQDLQRVNQLKSEFDSYAEISDRLSLLIFQFKDINHPKLKNVYNQWRQHSREFQAQVKQATQRSLDKVVKAEVKLRGYLNENKFINIVFSFGYFILACVVGLVISRSISIPLGLLTNYAEQLQRGEYHSAPNVRSPYELTRLADTMQIMASKILGAKKELEDELAERKRSQQQQIILSQFNQLLLDGVMDGVIGLDTDGLVTFANPSALKYFDIQDRNVLLTPFIDLFGLEEKDFKKTTIGNVLTQASKEITLGEKAVYVNGKKSWIEYTCTPLKEGEKFKGAVMVFRDISEKRKREERLKLTEEVFEKLTEAIIVTDENNIALETNQAFSSITLTNRSLVLGKKPTILNSLTEQTKLDEKVASQINRTGSWEGEIWTERNNGEVFPAQVSISSLDKNQSDSNRLITFSDITEKKAIEKKAKFLTFRDPLTLLANRSLFKDSLNNAIKEHQQKSRIAIITIDLDDFKKINESFSHDEGDELLKIYAQRLRATKCHFDTLARLASDEFAVIISKVKNVDIIGHCAKEILNSVALPIKLKGHDIIVTASLGVALYPDDADNANQLVKNAEAATLQAKRAGKNNIKFYHQDMNSQVEQHMKMELALRKAIENDAISLHYQPKVCPITGEIKGLEALARWIDPELGFVSPGIFIPMAEACGLIIPLGKLILRQCCQQIKTWIEMGYEQLQVAINLSAYQFLDENLFDNIQSLLSEYQLYAKNIEFEITESMLMDNIDYAISVMEKINNLGIDISMDDFGTGYSSLSYLKRFPIKTLKIDQSFVQHLTSDPDDAKIVATIIEMANNFNLDVVAEGVETLEQANWLTEKNCTYLQGYYLSKPLPVADITQLLKTNNFSSLLGLKT